MKALAKKKFTHQPRQQGDESDNDRMCVVCNKDQEYLFFCPFQTYCRKKRKETALVAIAAEMLKVAYHMLKNGTAYIELGENYMDDRRKQLQIKYHKEQLNKLLGEDLPGTQSV